MDNLPARTMLNSADVDALAASLHLLLGEVAVLAERVAALEGAEEEAAQARISALTERVLAPLGH